MNFCFSIRAIISQSKLQNLNGKNKCHYHLKLTNFLFQHNAKNTPIANNVIIIDIGIILLL